MSDDTLFPDEIPRAVAPYLVTITMTRPRDSSALAPAGGLVPPGGHAAVELAAVLVSARDVITAWMAQKTIDPLEDGREPVGEMHVGPYPPARRHSRREVQDALTPAVRHVA